jgi:hypothetical protein
MKGKWWIYPTAFGYHVNCSSAHFVRTGEYSAVCNSTNPTKDLFSRTITLDEVEARKVTHSNINVCKNCIKKINNSRV